MDRSGFSSSAEDAPEFESSIIDVSSPPGVGAVEAVRRRFHHQPPSAPTTVTLAAAAVKPQPGLSPVPAAETAGGVVIVRVAGRDDGARLATPSTVDEGDGATVGNWLGEAMRAAGTYSSPPRSLPEPPLPPACGGFCVAGGVGCGGFGVAVCVGSLLADWDGLGVADEVGSLLADWDGLGVADSVGSLDPDCDGFGADGISAAARCLI
jgi:hypothetical protein